jgi:hypothetical protein
MNRQRPVRAVHRQHHDSETRELGDVGGELTECSRFFVRAPVVVAVGDALEHAAGSLQLAFEVSEEESAWIFEGGRAGRRCGSLSRGFDLEGEY